MSHCLRLSSLIRVVMLNMINVELGFISDVDMNLFFEKVMRGGVFYVSKRYSKSNNNDLKSYDPKKNQGILYTLTQINYM